MYCELMYGPNCIGPHYSVCITYKYMSLPLDLYACVYLLVMKCLESPIRVSDELASSPAHTPTKEWPGIYCSRMREIITRIYEIGSVNISVNRLSHLARSSIETVYKYSKQNYKPDFLLLRWLSNQSSVLEEPVIFYPLRL